MKILIAEDDQFLTKIYRMTLEQEGFEVTLAKDGVQAMEFVKKDKPAVILLDIIMPKKDGFEVLKELKESAEFKDIPVLVLSNLGQESDIAKARKAGAVDYVIKGNVEVEDVIKKIKKYA